MTRLLKNNSECWVPATRKAGKETIFVPEGVFSFTTVFGVILDEKDGWKIVWTLANDRKDKNLWTPLAGGEDDYPTENIIKPYSIMDYGQTTGKREALEEAGVGVELMGTGPVWICGLPYAYPHYKLAIFNNDSPINDPARRIKARGVHTLLFYYLARVIGEPKLMEQAGAEHKYRNVDMKILSIEESFLAFKTGEMKAYPTLLEAFLRVVYLLTHANHNPYLMPYPENWAEKEGLMERPWKNTFFTF